MVRRVLAMGLGVALAAVLAPVRPAAADPKIPILAGVGMVLVNGKPQCSGVLVAPDLVATAAHCIKSPKRAGLEFRTGAYPGHPAAHHRVGAVLVHPLYTEGPVNEAGRVAADVALLRLNIPVSDRRAGPIALGEPAVEGEPLLIAAWPLGHGRRARERVCAVLSATARVANLPCEVQPGESGGPVLRLTAEGPEIAAIVIARTRVGRQPYGIAAQARSRVNQIRATYAH